MGAGAEIVGSLSRSSVGAISAGRMIVPIVKRIYNMKLVFWMLLGRAVKVGFRDANTCQGTSGRRGAIGGN